MTTIQVRVDDNLKAKADALFKELGTDTTSAVRMFLAQAVAYEGIPFEIKKINKNNSPKGLTEYEVLQRLDASRLQSKNGQFMNANNVLNDLKEKYNL